MFIGGLEAEIEATLRRSQKMSWFSFPHWYAYWRAVSPNDNGEKYMGLDQLIFFIPSDNGLYLGF